MTTLLAYLVPLWMLSIPLWIYLTLGSERNARLVERHGNDESFDRRLHDRFVPYRWKALGAIIASGVVLLLVSANFG